MERYANKRVLRRQGNGRFRQSTMTDMGIGGVCPKCSHLLLRHYDGDPHDPHPDPRNFRYRCFTCEPLTPEEQAREKAAQDARPKPPTFLEFLDSHIKALDAAQDQPPE